MITTIQRIGFSLIRYLRLHLWSVSWPNTSSTRSCGWGSTGPDVGPHTVWTQKQADDRFALDLDRFGSAVRALLKDVPTSAGRFAALVSLTYNIGAGPDGLSGSTLLRKHLAGDFDGARAEFARWNKANGKVMRGLTRRRAQEAALYGRAV